MYTGEGEECDRIGKAGVGVLHVLNPLPSPYPRPLPTFPSSIIDEFANLQFPQRLTDPDLFFPQYLHGGKSWGDGSQGKAGENRSEGNTPNLFPPSQWTDDLDPIGHSYHGLWEIIGIGQRGMWNLASNERKSSIVEHSSLSAPWLVSQKCWIDFFVFVRVMAKREVHSPLLFWHQVLDKTSWENCKGILKSEIIEKVLLRVFV